MVGGIFSQPDPRSLSDIHVLRDTSASVHVARYLHILCGTLV